MKSKKTGRIRSRIVSHGKMVCGCLVMRVKPHVKESDFEIMENIIERRKSAFEKLSKY